MPENRRPSTQAYNIFPRTMAPSGRKTSASSRNVRMLVAHRNFKEKCTGYNCKDSVTKESDGVFFMDDKDCYTDVLSKMATHCMKPVSRIFYIDSDDDELPIDSDVEFKEALKLIGQRTDKGQFTSMRIETGESQKNEKKRAKKPSKLARVKVTTKLSDACPPGKVTSTNKADTEPKLQKISVSTDESSFKTPQHGVSHWLKNYLQQFKKELMTEFQSLLEPYIAEQKKMSDLISSLNSSLISEKNWAENIAFSVAKEQTESDHNYSASASCMNTQADRKPSTAINDSEEIDVKVDEIVALSEEEEELPLPCSSLDEGEDDNLSICSGEISVTESESDGSSDDFVEVPLPSCFDVVAVQEGSKPKKVTKEMKHMKTSLKVKVGKVSKYEVLSKCEEGSQLKTNNLLTKEPETNSELFRKTRSTPKQDNQPVLKALIAPMESNNATDALVVDHFPDDEDYDEVELEIEEDYVNVGEEEGHNLDCDCIEEYPNEFNAGKIENSTDSGKQELVHESLTSRTYPQSFLDQSGYSSQVLAEMTKQQEYAPTLESFKQNDSAVMEDGQEKYLEADLPSPPCNETQYNVVTQPNSQMASKLPSAQSHSLANTQQGAFLLNGTAVPGSISYMQLPDATLMPKSLQPVQQPVQQTVFQQPRIWKHTLKTPQGVGAQRLIETAQAAVLAQHLQLHQAAQRVAFQVQQTQALGQRQPLLYPGRTSTACQENPPTVSGLQSNPNSQVHKISLLGDNYKVLKIGKTQVGSAPHQMQEAAQEQLKLWNEVDHVHFELRKWVLMCLQLMETIPKQVDDSSPTMPECLKKLASTALKTHHELEKVYQNFRKEVQLVSTQMDAHKQQKQDSGCGPLIADDPIIILPEKLMHIISVTLNTTFSILGNIAKLGVAPSSVLPDQGAASTSAEKPQPHMSANVSPVATAYGNTNNARLRYAKQPMPHSYYQSYVSQLPLLSSENVPMCGALADPLANQETNITYRMHPVGPASTFGPNYPLIWGQNVSTYTTAQTLGQTQTQPTMLGQPQTQQQTAPIMPRQLPQQFVPQLPLHLAMMNHHQQAMSQMAPLQQVQPQMLQPLQAPQISRDDTPGRQINPQENNRIESAFSGMQLHDCTPVTPDSSSACYSNLKPLPAGFCTKSFGGIMKR